MPVASILALIQAAAQTATALRPLVEQTLTVANTDDAAAIKSALAGLQANNDHLHASLSDKLEAASKL